MIINYFCFIDFRIESLNVNEHDTVRYWPTCTAQTWSIIGSAATVI